jgi:hypothetical protein
LPFLQCLLQPPHFPKFKSTAAGRRYLIQNACWNSDDRETQQRKAWKTSFPSSSRTISFSHNSSSTTHQPTLHSPHHQINMAFFESRTFMLSLRAVQAILTVLVLGLTGFGKLDLTTTRSEPNTNKLPQSPTGGAATGMRAHLPQSPSCSSVRSSH